MVIPSGLLFGPSGEFHHHIGFGPFPFFYMVWNGEDPAPGSLQIIKGYEVWFNPMRFGVLLAIWLVLFAGAVRLMCVMQRARVTWKLLVEMLKPQRYPDELDDETFYRLFYAHTSVPKEIVTR